MPSTGNILDVVGVPHSQELLPGTAAGKDSGVGPLANPQVTAKGIPGYLPSSPNRPAGILDVADLEAGNAPVTDGLRVGDEGVSDGCGQMRALQTEQGQDLTANGGRNQFARSCENTADSQINQGLTIERLIGSVIRAEEHAEEIEQLRAEEGALIEASGYQSPEYERNGR